MAIGKSSIQRAAKAEAKSHKASCQPEEKQEKQVRFMAEAPMAKKEKKTKSVSLKQEMPTHLL